MLTLSSLVKGEIQGHDGGQWVQSWGVAVPFSENRGLHLGEQVHGSLWAPWRSVRHGRGGLCLGVGGSLKCSLI